jgi:hypothetical protein
MPRDKDKPLSLDDDDEPVSKLPANKSKIKKQRDEENEQMTMGEHWKALSNPVKFGIIGTFSVLITLGLVVFIVLIANRDSNRDADNPAPVADNTAPVVGASTSKREESSPRPNAPSPEAGEKLPNPIPEGAINVTATQLVYAFVSTSRSDFTANPAYAHRQYDGKWLKIAFNRDDKWKINEAGVLIYTLSGFVIWPQLEITLKSGTAPSPGKPMTIVGKCIGTAPGPNPREPAVIIQEATIVAESAKPPIPDGTISVDAKNLAATTAENDRLYRDKLLKITFSKDHTWGIASETTGLVYTTIIGDARVKLILKPGTNRDNVGPLVVVGKYAGTAPLPFSPKPKGPNKGPQPKTEIIIQEVIVIED